MNPLVECVPNISEGRDSGIINAIVEAVKTTEGVSLLDVDPGKDTHRTVITFIGPPPAVLKAAFKLIQKAAELIDMSKHVGAHPRMGATDVCPFVPVSGVTMEDCVVLANRLGKMVADSLQIPVYLYEAAAKDPSRQNLAEIRKGEYEGLSKKLADPKWQPDYGAPVFNPKSGATIIGAREFLIAYNVNLNTVDKKLAEDIAFNIREAGRGKREGNIFPYYFKGELVKDSAGKSIFIPGKFRKVKAIGWYIEDYGCAQISINLTDHKISPLHLIYEEIRKEAEERGLIVTGSEIVGMVPLEVLLEAGHFYYHRQGKSPAVPTADLIKMAIRSLGLSDVAPFDPAKKIIEYQIKENNRLASLTVRDFVNEVSRESPAPGGGSVAALSGALCCALTAMVANLTHGKKGYEAFDPEMIEAGQLQQGLLKDFIRAIDADTDAFNQLMTACKAPKEERDKAVLEATLEAIQVPMQVLEQAVKALNAAVVVARDGNKNSASDVGVAAATGGAAALGAYLNVQINLAGLSDKTQVEPQRERAKDFLKQAKALEQQILEIVEAHIKAL